MPKRSRKPSDLNALAASIVDDATDEAQPEATADAKNPAAVELGRRGGLKGGRVRAERMSPSARREAAQRAARARWSQGKS